MIRRYLPIFIILTLVSCKDKLDFFSSEEKTIASQTKEDKGRLIARVGSKKLFQKDISDIANGGTTKDSTNTVNSYIQQWTRRMAILEEAEANVSPDLNIDQLVEDYRSSLILHNYKINLVEKELNTSVSEKELESFYAKHRNDFKLGEKVAKIYLAKIKPDADINVLKKFYWYWEKNNISKIDKKIKKLSSYTFTEKDRWVTASELSTILPPNINPNRLKKGNDYKKYKGAQYYVKVFDVIPANRTAPLSLVKDQVEKTIINERKKNLIQNFEQNLYNKALEQNKIEVLVK